MEENSRVTKHFFKVMSRDFHSKLALPKAFCRNLNEVKLANITSAKGIWKINVSRSNSETVFFEEGWGDFVLQHHLAVGDIVVFEHIGEMRFNAFVFDFTACEKEFDNDLAERNEGSAGVCNNLEAIKTNAGSSCQHRDPYFVITMKHHNTPDYRQPYMVPSPWQHGESCTSIFNMWMIKTLRT
ncbi:B3 domain-containing Os01g0723500-like [Olea europaea subsp. europaea]|uniref:B3 domain-containing Os01g0723500-like n=1 Tax=Olea europaea subsp. europaea TaxID=158383 RepID=A0A8S0TAY2_OLEEU|nr:B3 domain-containing Os01g0723500-like [Olea europaea subsp. europaea]